MAAKAIKHFRLRELARAPPPILKPTPSLSAGSPFDYSKFDFSQPRVASATPSSTRNLPRRTNPFVPSKNPHTGRWSPPKYSLRQQADLVKKACASGTLLLLPPSPKTSAAHLAGIAFAKAQPVSKQPNLHAAFENRDKVDANETGNSLEGQWDQPIEWVGQVKERTVPGAEIGNRLYAGKKRMFKGHKWERLAEKKALKRKMLMRDMAKRIERYKQYYKRKRPNPLKPSKISGGKLPF